MEMRGRERSALKSAPARGSFPLDHGGKCQELARAYMKCLTESRMVVTAECREISKRYLECRMNEYFYSSFN